MNGKKNIVVVAFKGMKRKKRLVFEESVHSFSSVSHLLPIYCWYISNIFSQEVSCFKMRRRKRGERLVWFQRRVSKIPTTSFPLLVQCEC